MHLKWLRVGKTKPTVTTSVPIVAIHLGKANKEGVSTTSKKHLFVPKACRGELTSMIKMLQQITSKYIY